MSLLVAPFCRNLLPVLLGGLLALLLLSGCSSFSSNEPPVPDTTLTRVLVELHLTSTRESLDIPSRPGLRDSVLTRYDLEEEDLEASLQYYSRRPEAFESLYEAVVDSLRSTRYNQSQGSSSE